ncbi:AAA family ATPase [Nocardia sp. NPDC005825]|uniref:AAA family ATPase n=1 Tax=Nocardia sp. NPDC005825 TaxID=3155452 RepID=UPI0033DCD4CC
MEPFVGRDHELITLDAAYRISGDRRVFLVEGPAGIGKSRLLAESTDRARAAGLRTIAIAATEYEQSTPRQVLAALSDQLTSDADAITGDVRSHDDIPSGDDIRSRSARASGDDHSSSDTNPSGHDPILDGDAQGGPANPLVAALDNRESARWLRVRLGGTPTVLILDDVHWADRASLDVLAGLIRQLPDRVVVILAYRAGQFPPELAAAVRALRIVVTHLTVPPLSEDEAIALLPEIPPARRARLVEAAHGNPLYLQVLAELTPAELDQAVRADHLPSTGPGPAALDRTLRAELAHLPARERLVAQAAAVCGATADPELLCATAEVTRSDLDAAVDDLARRGWLTLTTGTVDFRHPLIRTAAYRLAGPAWRAAAHHRAAEFLRAAHSPVLTRARHLEHAFSGHDPLAAADLLRAAEQSLPTAPATSARWIEAALRRTPDPAATHPANLLLGRALLLSGAADRARDVLEPLLPHDDPPPNSPGTEFAMVGCGEAVLLYARCERILGRVEGARHLLTRVVERLDPGASGAARLELAVLESQDNRHREAEARIQALFESGSVRDPAIRAAARTLRSMAQLNGLDLTAARAEYRAAEREYAGLTDSQLIDGVHAVAALGWMAYFLDDQRTGLIHIERAIRVSRRRGHSFVLPELHTVHAYSLGKIGRYEDALAAAEDALETAQLYGYPGIAPLAGAIKLRVLEDIAPPEEVLRWWRTLDALPRPAMHWWRGVVEAALAEIAGRLAYTAGLPPSALPPHPAITAAQGTAVPARSRSDASRPPLPDPAARPESARPRAHPMQAAEFAVTALGCVARGDLDTAALLVARAEEAAERLDLPGQRAAAARARAGYLCARGDLDGAGRAAQEAIAHYRDAGMPVFRAQAMLLEADIAGQRGDFATATARIAAAREEFAAAGAHELLTAATAAQRKLAGHRSVSGATTLSEREREVAELAARGLTNKSIAEQLYLSPRTVEDHLGRILRKLGITGRAGIAHRLAELDRGTGSDPLNVSR